MEQLHCTSRRGHWRRGFPASPLLSFNPEAVLVVASVPNFSTMAVNLTDLSLPQLEGLKSQLDQVQLHSYNAHLSCRCLILLSGGDNPMWREWELSFMRAGRLGRSPVQSGENRNMPCGFLVSLRWSESS